MIKQRQYPALARQTWLDIYFMHWRVNPEKLQPYVKQPYELDLFDNSAWISVVCFRAKNSRLRFFPFDIVSSAIQTNVRTYVTLPNEQEPGVYFLELFLNNRFAVSSARVGVNLPFEYVDAMSIKSPHVCTYKSRNENGIKLHAAFHDTGKSDESQLAQFLTDRYVIWNEKGNRLIKIPITHPSWRITSAEATVLTNQTHPLIQGRQPDIVHAGDDKLTCLYPYETVGFVL